jgi:hypothetical protein
MDASKWLVRLIEAAVITVTLAAVCQELEKPREERLRLPFSQHYQN